MKHKYNVKLLPLEIALALILNPTDNSDSTTFSCDTGSCHFLKLHEVYPELDLSTFSTLLIELVLK
jgi:hypothetical protein